MENACNVVGLDDSMDSPVVLRGSAKMRRQSMPEISVYDYSGVLKLLDEAGIDQKHAFRMWRYFVNHSVKSVEEVPELPKKMYSLIQERCSMCLSRIVERQESIDRSTTKLLIELFDGQKIESVIMRYGSVELDSFPQTATPAPQAVTTRAFRCAPRATVCVSSQVGCAMGCRFCATGSMGLMAHLTSGEIIEQLVLASRIEPLKNVVFMGMGEPLDNYAEVLNAIRMMIDVRIFHLASHRISLSTVGVVPRLRQLKKDAPGVSLALSLHAPTQEIREKIVPSARAWKLEAILDAALDFVRTQKTLSSRMMKNQTILVEYVMIKDINVMPNVAHLLGELLKPHSDVVHLNFIPYNPTYLPSTETMRAPDAEEIDCFVSLVRSYGLKCTIRQTLGQDIGGACGQLVVANQVCVAQDLEDGGKPPCHKHQEGCPTLSPEENKTSRMASFKNHVQRKMASCFSLKHPWGYTLYATVFTVTTAFCVWCTLQRSRRMAV